eukprot:CAMPEP_0206556202 /NCGR_PEP_ID=MMETSP0325_2-20121206/18276_1 /ASSEMBLY_ACC=CAM_ASM_000347 /TAXON_ID=2866 /ORGANISM="Crypthecodinium cohnii, Strain Seligo" /LENGTH=656 /DNA_ID=CAMNT_0054056703 /DNA_START=71 /DNA_END=2041 /DNA_ORIENTATION=-
MGQGITCQRASCSGDVEDCGVSAAIENVGRRNALFSECSGGDEGGEIGQSQSSGSHQRALGKGGGVGVEERSGSERSVAVTHKATPQTTRFCLRHIGAECDWRRRYILGRELGAGQTATVFEAFVAVGGSAEDVTAANPQTRSCSARSCTGSTPEAPQNQAGSGPKGARPGRKVAIKRFHNQGTAMFHQELKALLTIGVHPHCLRLLEAYEADAGNDDVLVLEHCDGGDVYDLYAANEGCCMLEAFVIQLIRQLLLALQHLVVKGVEHRDVKPENLLLFGGSTARSAAPLLKLGDFGWATVVPPGAAPPAVPPDGVGSLWYAPPELNPPSMLSKGLQKVQNLGGHVPGSSDMWSVGIITYLLLVGHSPFNAALRIADPLQREAEVIKLAESGQINVGARSWPRLSPAARAFITSLIVPYPGDRLSVEQAWEHPWIKRWQEASPDRALGSPSTLLRGCDERMRKSRWENLDAFQRLGWLAIARSVAEPELAEFSAFQAFLNDEGSNCYNYLHCLAMELAALVQPAWFSAESSWGEVLRLAFHYMDLDGDGLLNARDISQHLLGEDAKQVTSFVLSRWSSFGEITSPFLRGPRHLTYVDFCTAIAATTQETGAENQSEEEAAKADSAVDAILDKRMSAIDEVCQRFLDEEFDELGFGL